MTLINECFGWNGLIKSLEKDTEGWTKEPSQKLKDERSLWTNIEPIEIFFNHKEKAIEFYTNSMVALITSEKVDSINNSLKSLLIRVNSLSTIFSCQNSDPQIINNKTNLKKEFEDGNKLYCNYLKITAAIEKSINERMSELKENTSRNTIEQTEIAYCFKSLISGNLKNGNQGIEYRQSQIIDIHDKHKTSLKITEDFTIDKELKIEHKYEKYPKIKEFETFLKDIDALKEEMFIHHSILRDLKELSQISLQTKLKWLQADKKKWDDVNAPEYLRLLEKKKNNAEELSKRIKNNQLINKVEDLTIEQEQERIIEVIWEQIEHRRLSEIIPHLKESEKSINELLKLKLSIKEEKESKAEEVWKTALKTAQLREEMMIETKWELPLQETFRKTLYQINENRFNDLKVEILNVGQNAKQRIKLLGEESEKNKLLGEILNSKLTMIEEAKKNIDSLIEARKKWVFEDKTPTKPESQSITWIGGIVSNFFGGGETETKDEKK